MILEVEFRGLGGRKDGGGVVSLSGLFGLLAVVSLHLADRQVYCAQVSSDVAV